MKPTIVVPTQEWRQAAQELYRTSSRSCVDFTNGQALKVSIEAVRQTMRANAAKIRAGLNEINEAGVTAAQRILAWRFRKTKKWGVKGATLAEKIRRFIAGRVKSAAFIASGWIPARRKLFAVVRQKPALGSTFAGAKQYGEDKGDARPASFGLRSKIISELENTALITASQFPSKPHDPMPVAQQGLSKALQVAAKDMIETLAKRLNQDLRKFTRK